MQLSKNFSIFAVSNNFYFMEKNYEYLTWVDGNLRLEHYVSDPESLFNAICVSALRYPETVRNFYGIIRTSTGVTVKRVSTQSIIQGVRKIVNRLPSHCYISGPDADPLLEYNYKHLKTIKHGRKEVLYNEWKRMANF